MAKKNIIIDANVFYYYANMRDIDTTYNKETDRVDSEKLNDHLEKYIKEKRLIITSITMMEIIVRCMSNVEHLKKALSFFLRKGFMYYEGNNEFTLYEDEIRKLYHFVLNKNENEAGKLVGDILLRKARSESSSSYEIIQYILLPVLCEVAKSNECFAEFFVDMFKKSQLKDRVIEITREALIDGYLNRKAKSVFFNIMDDMFSALLTFIDKDRMPTEFALKYEEYLQKKDKEKEEGDNSNPMLALNFFVGYRTLEGKDSIDKVRRIIKQVLYASGTNKARVEHILVLYDYYFIKDAKIRKNDIFDNVLIGFHGTDKYILSFDGQIEKALAEADKENKELICSFYKIKP